MSRPIRPYGPHPTVPGGMIPPMGVTGTNPLVPHGYGLVAGQAHYVPHPSYPQNFSNIPNQIPVVPAVPGPLPGMYVPVTTINPAVRPPNLDPSKLLEEQRRLEKERNFQLQQQRLKQFTIAGKKGNVNAESLIDSMFGKVQSKSGSITSNLPAKPAGNVSSEPPKSTYSGIENFQAPSVNINKVETFTSAPVKQEKKDKKELEAMMRECSNFSGPQKASKFSKPLVKEVSPSTHQKFTFAASNKARDWSNLQGLDKVFVSRPRFPDWCKRETIPELYQKVEAVVTNNGAHTPETKLLFPLLLSSGLPQQMLGKIWELVNQSAPGYLTIEEMYAALALIAVTQAGYQVTTVDILHQLPACPIPQLQCFVDPSNEGSDSQVKSTPSPEDLQSNTHQVVRPSAINLKDPVYPDASNSAGNAAADLTGSPDDEFDDFKSATPTAVNFSLQTPSKDSLPDDDFADFQQALPSTTVPFQTASPAVPGTIPFPPSVSTAPPVSVAPQQDLMSPEEDKYSVFRSLQQNEEEDDWGDFSTPAEPAKAQEQPAAPDVPSGPASLPPPVGGLFAKPKEDAFGDFLQADAAGLAAKFEGLDANFADFSNFSNKDEEFGDFSSMAPPVVKPDPLPNFNNKDEEFGDFSSAAPPLVKPEPQPDFSNFNNKDEEFGDFSAAPAAGKPDFFFHHLRDNVSLGETQSVSSLELGTFDGGGHSGESKSSLSRQGSIPSLDLKSTYLEGADNDEFGEFQTQSFVQRGSKSPSPANDTKPSDNNSNTSNGTSLGIPFHNSRTVPLADKYSVIRAEQKKDEDQHISCWVRCLQSSVNILQNTKKVFNQMSCSSVCNEVLQTEEGENYIRDVIEVYKVIRRISTASKSVGKQTIPISDLLKEADQAWNTVSGFLAGSALLPTESTLEFSNAVLSRQADNNTKACGLCLLNVEAKTKSQHKMESLILSYGGRNYHSPCANLWVNCVDPLLPALTLPQLL